MHKIIRTLGQRIAWTNTSHISDQEVVAAIKFVAREVDLNKTIIHFKHMGRYRRTYGMAYWGIPSIANLDGLKRSEWRYLISMTDRGEKKLTDGVIFGLAHEGKHIEQYRERLSRSEVRCNAFGAWVADRWKEQTA
jgi:hypothetical protein